MWLSLTCCCKTHLESSNQPSPQCRFLLGLHLRTSQVLLGPNGPSGLDVGSVEDGLLVEGVRHSLWSVAFRVEHSQVRKAMNTNTGLDWVGII